MINLNEIMRRPIYEPRPRRCAGVYGYVAHRFPVKDGISMREVMMRQLANGLYGDVVGKNPLVEAFERSEARE